MARDLIDVIAAAHRQGGVVVCLNDLIVQLGMEDSLFPAIAAIDDQFGRARLELVPGTSEGGLETERFLRPVVTKEVVQVLFLRELAEHEGPSLECKSSLLYDRKRAANVPDATAASLKSEDVLESTLKTICAFLNAEGGVLLVGVADNGPACGIADDFPYVGAQAGASRNEQCDKWQLLLRSVIKERFHEGARVNDAVSVSLLEHETHTVARLAVGRRKRLAFVKFKGRLECFMRRGNRTDRLEPYEIEQIAIERATGDSLA